MSARRTAAAAFAALLLFSPIAGMAAAPPDPATPTDSAARPARGPKEQNSVAKPAPHSGTQHTTGTNQVPPKVKQMNQEAAKTIEKTGK